MSQFVLFDNEEQKSKRYLEITMPTSPVIDIKSNYNFQNYPIDNN